MNLKGVEEDMRVKLVTKAGISTIMGYVEGSKAGCKQTRKIRFREKCVGEGDRKN